MRKGFRCTWEASKPLENLWLSPSRNPLRKVKDAVLSWQLERAEAASQRYFGKSAADLDEYEAAPLAACLPKPGRWNPGGHSAVALRRTERILGRMEKAQFLWKEI